MIRRLLRRLRFPVLILAAFSLGGCASLANDIATVAKVIAEASQYESDAAVWLATIEDAEKAFFSAAPDVAAQAALESKLTDARSLLQAAGQATDGAKDLTQGDLDKAYAEFVSAAESIANDAEKIGLFKAPVSGVASSNAVAADAVKPAAPPLPLCVRHAKGDA